VVGYHRTGGRRDDQTYSYILQGGDWNALYLTANREYRGQQSVYIHLNHGPRLWRGKTSKVRVVVLALGRALSPGTHRKLRAQADRSLQISRSLEALRTARKALEDHDLGVCADLIERIRALEEGSRLLQTGMEETFRALARAVEEADPQAETLRRYPLPPSDDDEDDDDA